jgi:hypothetical protein
MEQPSEMRERITAAVAAQFSCYGADARPCTTPVGRTLADQPPTFSWGVPVRAVVDFVLDMAEGPSA